MVREIIMPKLGETMEEGVVAKWLKAEGDGVEKGEPVLEVTTDKATFEVEAPVSGVLRKIVVPAGEIPVPVRTVIGFIAGDMNEPVPEVKEVRLPALPAATHGVAAPAASPQAVQPAAAGPVSSGVRASPRARKLAEEKGVDLGRVKGTGPGGRIVEKDVLDAASGAGGAPPAGAGALTGLRKVIAQRMSQAKREIPHFYLSVDVDMTACAGARPEGVSFNDIVIKAVARALESFPRLNALFEDGGLREVKDINVATAVSLEDGLVAPVIRGTPAKSLKEIAAATGRMKEKAKTGRFSPDDLAGGTFTVSNLGMLGVDSFTAIVNPPQVGILAVGTIKDAPVAAEGRVVVRKIMRATGSFDHRAVDGAYGARFLARFKEILEKEHGRL